MNFSIIIPVYNVAPYLRECIDSVLAQTFTDWEAICVDDGSTDGSGAILDEYAARDSRIRVIHQPNCGVSAARNVGLDVVRGEWVGFLDGDDAIFSDWLKTASVLASRYNIPFIRLAAQRVKQISSAIPPLFDWSSVEIYENQEVLEWGCRELLKIGWSGLLFVKSDRLVGLRFPVGMRLREDTIFDLNLISRINAACQCAYEGYIYRDVPGSAGRRPVLANDCVRFTDEIIQVWTTNHLPVELVAKEILNVFFWWRRTRDVNESKLDERKAAISLKKAISFGMPFRLVATRSQYLSIQFVLLTGSWYVLDCTLRGGSIFIRGIICLIDRGPVFFIKKCFRKCQRFV